MPLFGMLGLDVGDAHVIRNAGGVITEDTIRSLTISQHLLGTREIMLVHHTECGLQATDDVSFADRVEQATGRRPPWAARAFTDADDDVRESIRLVQESPYLLSARCAAPSTTSRRGVCARSADRSRVVPACPTANASGQLITPEFRVTLSHR